MHLLEIQCLGYFQVKKEGQEITSAFETEKARALLAYLAVEANRPQQRSTLAGIFWPDEPQERALHNLRQALSRIRKVLEEKPAEKYLLADRYSVQWNPNANVRIDVNIFLKQLAQAYHFFQQEKGSGGLHIRYLKRATNIVRGEFLAQMHLDNCDQFEEWSFLMREKFNMLALKAFSLLTNYHERRCEYQLALENNLKMIQLAPWDENARMNDIFLLALDGHWSAAQIRYTAYCQYLSDQLQVGPSSEMVKLQMEILGAAAGRTKFLPRYPSPLYNLPEIFSPFVGRDNEQDKIMEMIINPGNRLITLLGPGGIGKTRIAVQLSEQFVGLWKDGVFFVPCINAQSENHVIALLVESFGLAFSDKTDNKAKLFDLLHKKETLLILDNWEHLIPCPDCITLLNELLEKTRSLTVIVTSREKLNLMQESIYVLNGLPYPDEQIISIDQAAAFDSLKLFEQCARRSHPGFHFSETNLAAARNICKILDGLPLGIELSAAVVFKLGFAETAAIIKRDLTVLNARQNNFPARHRNLRAVFEVSRNLLNEEERDTLGKLSIFLGGFTRLAARKITGASPELLAALAEKSLIAYDGDNRYHIHETIRQFAGEMMSNSLVEAETAELHACYYADLLAEMNKDLKSQDQSEFLSVIQLEFGNISQMWKWLVKNRREAELSCSLDSLFEYFNIRSHYHEGIRWFSDALNVVEKERSNGILPGMLYARLGALATSAHDFPRAISYLLSAEEILSDYKANDELALCRLFLSWVYALTKDFANAQLCLHLCQDFFQQTGNSLGESQANYVLGFIRQNQGRLTEANQIFTEALHFCRPSGNPRQMILILNRLGDLACYEGHYELALAQFKESLAISKKLNDLRNISILLNNIGTIHHVQGSFDEAESYYQQSLAVCRKAGDLDGTAHALINLGELAVQTITYPLALQYASEALEIATELDDIWTISVCLNGLGEIWHHMGSYQKSHAYFVQAVQLALESESITLAVRVSINLARNFHRLGELSSAAELLSAAMAHPALAFEQREEALSLSIELGIPEINHTNDSLFLPALKAVLEKRNNAPVIR